MPDTDAVRLIDPPEGSVLIRSRSPGFTTRPPGITGAALIPDSVRLACAAWEQRAFAPRPLTVRVLREVYVAQEGLVFDRDGALLHDSIREHDPAMVRQGARAVREAIAGAEITRHARPPLVLGKKRGAANYGHWMIEMLPMLHLALSRLADPSIGVLVHDTHDRQLGEVMIRSLRRLGIDDPRVRVSGLAPVWVRTLLIVEGMTEHGTYMSPLVRDCHDRLAHGIDGRGHARLFLRRGPGASRQLRGEAALLRAAEEQGYRVACPASLPLEEQIALMRDAHWIAGVMGAAIANLIYAPAGARATLFAPATMPDTFFWFIANLRDIAYREVRCPQEAGEAGWNATLEVEGSAFRRALEAW